MRSYPELPDHLREALAAITPSRDAYMAYYPCAVTLDDGTTHDRVYVVAREEYLTSWGVLPEDDPGKRAVPLERVRELRESPDRLPADLANELYDAGESGMGYHIFTVEFSGGVRQAHESGNAVDFISAPPGLTARDAVRVFPGEGREARRMSVPEYAWCLWESRQGAA